LDELQHTLACLTIARRLDPGLTSQEPGPLPALAPRPSSWTRLAVDTFREGCVGESLAALRAQRAATVCGDNAIGSTLHRIAEDELRHAGLAWRTVKWAIEQGGHEVALAVRA